jgi:enoyl-CoA hydratase/carnithine racemase
MTTTETTTDVVTFEVGRDAVGVVTLNRPTKLNALSLEVFARLHEVAEEAGGAVAQGTVRAVLVTGAGRAFCAGLDLALFGEQVRAGGFDDQRVTWLQQAFTGLEDLSVPVVAAVRGAALGGGCQLALACHLRVLAPDARLGLLEARWGLLPDLGGTYRLPRLVGLGRATDLAVSGRMIDAPTALAWGLADAVLDDDDFPGAARRYASALAAGPTVASGALPGLLRGSLLADRPTALAAERAAQRVCLASGDFAEAVAAAQQGREPLFKGG